MTYAPKSNYQHVQEQRERDWQATAQYERILEILNITVRLEKDTQVIVAHNGKGFSDHRTAIDCLVVMLGGKYDSTAIRQMNNYLAYRVAHNLPSTDRVKRAIAETEKGSK